MNSLLSLILITNSKYEKNDDTYKLIKDGEVLVEVEMGRNHRAFSINTHSSCYDVVHEFIFESWIPSITKASAKQIKDTLVCGELGKLEAKQINQCLVIYCYESDNVSVKIGS